MSLSTTPDNVDAETGEIEKSTVVDSPRPVVLFTIEEAEAHTAKIISYGGVLLNLVHEAHDKGAWKVLGYKSFVAYVNDRLGYGKARAYQLLAYIVVTEQLALAADLDVTEVRELVTERATRGIDAATAAEEVKAKADALPDAATAADREQIVHETVEQHKTKTTVSKPSTGAEPSPPPPPAPVEPLSDESSHAADHTETSDPGTAPDASETEPGQTPPPASVPVPPSRVKVIAHCRHLVDAECGSAALLRKAMAELLEVIG